MDDLATNPFRSDYLGNVRYVWHPAVHAAAGEICTYMFVRIAVPAEEFHRSIGHLFTHLRIDSASIYALYGQYDYLIRFWATASKRNRFIDSFQVKYFTSEPPLFTASAINYLWNSDTHISCKIDRINEAHKSLIETQEANIRSVASDIAIGKTPAQEIIDELEQGGLVFKVPELRPPEIPENLADLATDIEFLNDSHKVFFIISRRTGSAPWIKSEYEVIQRLASKLKSHYACENLTIYSGSRDSHNLFVIKSLINGYDSIFEAALFISGELYEHDMRSETYPTAQVIGSESDDCDYMWGDLGSSGRSIEQLIDRNILGRFLRLDIESRSQLEQSITPRSINSLSLKTKIALKTILESFIINDNEHLLQAADYFSIFESRCRVMFTAEFKKHYSGKDFANNVVAKGKKIFGDKFDIKKMNLHTVLNIAHGLDPVNRALKDTLGKDWFRRCEPMVVYRNDFAHANMLDDDDYIGTNWRGLIKTVVDVDRVFRVVEGFVAASKFMK